MRIVYRTAFLALFILLCFYSHAQVTVGISTDHDGGCSPISVNFTGIISGTSTNATYYWDLGNGNHSTLQNPSAIYTQAKSYTVTLTVKDGNQTATQTKTITVYKKPIVDFTANSSKVCLPNAAEFTANAFAGDGEIASYQWDFGDGSTQQGYSSGMDHAYSVEQTATVGLTVTNSFGCQASVVKPDVVEILAPINTDFTADKMLLCALSETVQFTNNSTGPGALQYRWDFGDGTTSNIKSPSHRYNTKGIYPVKLTASNSVGCTVTSYPVEINAAYFNTDFSGSPLCREVNFTSSSYLYPSASLWKFGDGAESFSQYNTSHTYSAPGAFNVTLINTYDACRDTVTKSITVQEKGVYNSGIKVAPTVCQNTYVDFTSTSSTSPSQINWDFGDGNVSINSNNPLASHVYSLPGTYTVKLTNVFGTCSETVTKTIVVNALPDPKGFVVNYGGVCGSPVTVKFTDTTAGAVAWQWYMDYDYYYSFSSARNTSYLFPDDGYHTVRLTVTNGAGCSQNVDKSVNIFTPNARIDIERSSSPKGNYDCDSLRVRFVAASNQTIQTYNWDLGNGTTSTAEAAEAFYAKSGTYNITLNYVTESGCKGNASYSVKVYDKPKADFSYSIPCGPSLNLNFRDASFFSDDWEWNFGDGDYAYNNFPTHYFADTGKSSVQFINHIGHCADTIVKTVYANLLPSSVTITKAENTCEGNRGTVTFGQQTLRATGLVWNFGDGTTAAYDTSVHEVKHAYAASGRYSVRLTGKYLNCVLTSSLEVTVLLKQSPKLTANKTEICASDNLTVQIDGLQTNPFAGNFQWNQYFVNGFEYNNGNAYTGNFNMYDFNYTSYTTTLSNFAAGATKLRAIVNSGWTGCSDTTNYINLQVNGPIAGFSTKSKEQCFKSPFIFIDTSRSVTSTPLTLFQWDFGDGTTQQSTGRATVQHFYATPGRYTVQLRVADATGCNSLFTTDVEARGTKATFTPSGLFIPNVPLNTTVTFYNNSNSYNTTPAYTWTYGDGATENAYEGSHTYTKAGTEKVVLIANDPSLPCADTAETIITVKDFNTAFSFNTSFLNNGSCPPVLLQINNLSVGYTSLKWDFGDGTTTTSSAYPSHVYQTPGLYKITLYTFGYNGLSGTYIDSIEVKEPSTKITADALQGCLSQTVNLNAASQNAGGYLWDFGDGNVSTTATVSPHSYNTPGLFTPRLIVTDKNGCNASADLPQQIVIDSLEVKIQDLPLVLCDSALIQFNPVVGSFAAANLGTQLRYQWSFGTDNAADTSNLASPAFRFVKPGTYVVKLKVASPYGCAKETAASVVINEKTKGQIIALPRICQDGSIQFIATAGNTNNVQWSWTFGNGNQSSLQAPPAQIYSAAGTYAITLLVKKNGCVDTVVHQLTVDPKPVIDAAPKNAVLCLGSSVSLSAGGGIQYQWTPAAGLSNAFIASPLASPSVTTTYRVAVTTDKGCNNIDSVEITVGRPVNVQLPSALEVCQGTSIQLNASGTATYSWIDNTAGLSNTGIANPVARPDQTITYTVIGADQYNCFKDTARVMITVRNLPTVDAGPDLQLPGLTPRQLSAAASPDVVSWLWSPGNELSCTACPSPMLTPKMERQYVVTVRNRWGCAASDSFLVKLDCGADHVFFPTAFTPNSDGKNESFYPAGSGVKKVKYLRIFSRWGNLLFERTNFAINDRSAGWNGQVKGQPAAPETYVYLAEMECSSGAVFTRQGTVTLIR